MSSSQRTRKRKKSNTGDKQLVMRIRQVSVLVGGILVLSAAVLLLTGILKPSGTDTYAGRDPALNPALYDPALQASATASAPEPGTTEPADASGSTDSAVAANPDTSPNPATEGGKKPAQDATSSGEGVKLVATAQADTPEEPASSPAATAAETASPATDPASSSASSPSAAGGEETIGDATLPASADWLELRIQKHRSDIDDADLADFRRIIQYLDQGYIGDLNRDGLNSDEQELLRAHLRSRLSAADYERSKTLFVTYQHLMDEE